MTFGPSFPLPALEYLRSVYFNYNLSDTLTKQIEALRAPHAREERSRLFSQLENSFIDEGFLFGLGSARARFIYPEDLQVNSQALISGELDLVEFEARKQ